jgi:hypothetical protein
MSQIRILLVGLPAMLSEIVSEALAGQPNMRVVAGPTAAINFGSYTRRRRVDAVIFVAGNDAFRDEAITGLLRANPRLCLLAIEGSEDRAILHHLVPTAKVFTGLAHATLVSAILAGTALRLE